MFVANLKTIFDETKMFSALVETLYMVGLSTFFAYLLGMPLGILAVITSENGILQCKWINKILGLMINLGRSIPFMILAIAVVGLTRLIVGRSWGTTAAIVPLTLAATFFVARLIEQSLKEVDKGVIESAICLGASNIMIIHKVYIKESLPTLLRGMAITIVNLIGYSAMAGALGAGGLGKVAISFGQQKFRDDIMLVTLIILVVIVQIIQLGFDAWAKLIDKK